MSQSSAPAPPAAWPPRRVAEGRQLVVRGILYSEAAFLVLIAAGFLTGGNGTDPRTVLLGGGLSVLGAGILVAGATRMRNDPTPASRSRGAGDPVPWDWTDFLMFWPGWFSAFNVIGVLAVSLANAVASGDPAVRDAIDASVLTVAQYGAMLGMIFVLGFLRRGATMGDLGWRGFRWWWVLIVPVAWYVADQASIFLQQLNESLFPSVSNGQCTLVRHDYSHYYALAIVVTCVVAPLAEETIFRGFIYGWLHRVSPAAVAVPISAAIFSAAHQQLVLFLPLFFVGVLLALLYQGSRSLVPGALTHALFNLPNIIAILSTTSSC